MGHVYVGQGDLVDRRPTLIWLALSRQSTPCSVAQFRPGLFGFYLPCSSSTKTSNVPKSSDKHLHNILFDNRGSRTNQMPIHFRPKKDGMYEIKCKKSFE